MTPPQRRALEVLWEWEPLTREEFAEKRWPDSASWGYQSAGMRNHCLEGAATTLLRRLQKMGLVVRRVDSDGRAWLLTDFGHRALRRERLLEKIAS